MDSKLRGKIILLIALVLIPVFIVVIYANVSKQKDNDTLTTVSALQEETVVSVEADNSSIIVSFELVGDDTSKWKKDETFFDSDKNTLAQKLLEEARTLTIKAYSSERDLRVQVIDYQGNLKSDEDFKIVAMDLETHEKFTLSDDDKDGVVYFSDLKPADYKVILQDIGDYIVPADGITVTVKADVEYVLIEDISLKLYNESDIDADKEDTMVLTASMSADRKQNTSYGQNTDVLYGIDIPGDVGEIDWNEVYKSGIRFVMLRAGYRGSDSGKLIIDKSFYANAKAASFSGLKVGAYFYSQAVSNLEAVEEASALLTIASEINLDYPYALRLDMAGGSGRADSLSEEKRTEIAGAFCDTIKNAGKTPCIYATKNWLDTNIDYDKLSNNLLWLADFHEPPMYEGYYDMWQYSSKGTVKGINGEVNLNISYIK